MDRLYKNFPRNAGFFSEALRLERELEGLTYVPASAAALTLICPRRALYEARELELETFARALRDRVKYAVLLKIADQKHVDLLTKRALRGDERSLRSLLNIGRGITAEDLARILPELREEFEKARRASAKVFVTAARGLVREAAVYVKYAEPHPFAGMGHLYQSHVFYAVAGLGEDYVYLFRIDKGADTRRLALAEGDVAAAAFRRRKIKVHIYSPGVGIRTYQEEAADPTPRYRALIGGECRPGRHCLSCKYKEECECAAKGNA